MNKLSNTIKTLIILCLIVVAVGVVVAVSWIAVERVGSTDASPSASSTPEGWPTPDRSVAAVDVPGDGTFVTADTVDRSSADKVAESFAMIATSFDTVRDSNESAALERARPLMAPELEETMSAPDRPTPWTQPREHDAFSVPAATRMDNHAEGQAEPTFPGTGEKIEPYTYRVSHPWQGRDGWVSEKPDYRTVFLSLVEREGRWSVIEYGYRDPLS